MLGATNIRHFMGWFHFQPWEDNPEEQHLFLDNPPPGHNFTLDGLAAGGLASSLGALQLLVNRALSLPRHRANNPSNIQNEVGKMRYGGWDGLAGHLQG